MNKMYWIALIVTGLIIALILSLTALSPEKKASTNTTQTGMAFHHSSASGAANQDNLNALIGKPALDFSLESYDGKIITLSQLKGKRVVLFFTEGLMCYPACWNQMVAFTKDPAFNNSDTVVLSISVDRKDEWQQAAAKMPELSKATVLFDSDKSVSNQYGVLNLTSSMHRGEFPGHTYIIVDKDGVVRYTKDDPQMAIRNTELKDELAKL